MTKRMTAAVLFLAASALGHGVALVPRLVCAAAQEPASAKAEPLTDVQPKSKGEEQNRSGAVRLLSGGRLALSPDGKTLAMVDTSSWRRILLWNPATGRKKGRLELEQGRGSVGALAVSPDGKLLAAGGYSPDDRLAVRLWDLDAGKMIREIRTEEGYIDAVAFSPDGKKLAGLVPLGDVYLWETATGKELHCLKRDKPMGTWAGHGFYGFAFSPDGKTLAAGGANAYVWDVVSGKKLLQLEAQVHFVAFSLDNKTLFGAGLHFPPQAISTRPNCHATIYSWDVVTGREHKLAQLPEGKEFWGLLLTPDGRTLVTAGGPHDRLRLWEVATGKERCLLEASGAQNGMAFFPAGQALAASSFDERNLRICDLHHLPGQKKPAGKPSPKELEALWADLASDDAANGYRAVCTLIRWPEVAVPFLKEHVQPFPRTDPQQHAQRIARLIKELDSDSFEEREKATAELAKLGRLAEPALLKALEHNPSAELRKRAQHLLADRLRSIRALEVLEHIGNAEARQVLEVLAKGAARTELTDGAKAALERLAKRAPIRP